jgi:rSAM/selenodomain-associated transferase 2
MKISIIIPVLNEADIIDRTLGQFSSALPHEIIIVDGDPSGSTIGTINTPGIISAKAPKGRASQMNHGAKLASGNALLFLHADTLLPQDALTEIAVSLSGGSVQWGAFDLGIESDRLFYRLIETTVRIRTAITRIPYGDQAIFLTKDLFRRMGGYPRIPIMEDVALMRRVKKSGVAGCRIPKKVGASPRRWEREGIIRCTLRNWLLIASYLLGGRPGLLAKHYRPK